jgi:hypothetical protein
MSIGDVLDRMEKAEQSFAGTEFLAPVVGAARVNVRLAGIVCQLHIAHGLPAEFAGWALLRARSTSQAEFVRPAGLSEVAAYLALFPAVRLILATKEHAWLAYPAQSGDRRFAISGPVPVLLAEDGLERFETVVARFDGRLFWYERRDPGRDPALAAYLREQLARPEPLPDEALHKPGLSREEREVYACVALAREQGQQARAQQRLGRALAHAGAELQSFAERGGVYVVTYQVDGRQHVSTIQRDDLSVVTAGVCLTGQDRRFDLTSLVGVLREGARRHQLVWVGDEGLDEREYWQVHPPAEPPD